LLASKIKEIKDADIYKTLCKIYVEEVSKKNEDISQIWLYILEVLYIIKSLTERVSKNANLVVLGKYFIDQPIGFLNKKIDIMNGKK
jgi:hypothetical protein